MKFSLLFALLALPFLMTAQSGDFDPNYPIFQPVNTNADSTPVAAATPAPQPTPAPATRETASAERNIFGNKKVTIPAGTELLFQTAERLDPARLNEGQQIFVLVAQDVVIDQKVIFSTNTRAVATITHIQTPTSTSPQEIELRVERVRDTAGNTVSLHGPATLIRGAMPGMSETVAPGRTVRAFVLNNTETKL